MNITEFKHIYDSHGKEALVLHRYSKSNNTFSKYIVPVPGYYFMITFSRTFGGRGILIHRKCDFVHSPV